MYQLFEAGREAFDVFTKSNRFACVLVRQPKGHWSLYWNSNATRGSARKFATAPAAIEFMHARRVAKGWKTT
jgi:hypothetical protein